MTDFRDDSFEELERLFKSQYEVALVKELSHPNVVKLLDVFCSTKKLVLVFEFLEYDLGKYMKSVDRVLDPKIIQYLSYQLCDGIQFCHANRILHRDLKPQNLLIDSKLRLKIADFDLARPDSVLVRNYTPEVVTVWYRPPEILLGCTHYRTAADIWSVGCTIAEMATGFPLFAGDSEIGTIFQVFEKLGTPTVEQWPGLMDLPHFKPTFPQWRLKGWETIRNTRAQIGVDGMDLLDRLLAYDPRRRVNAHTALQRRYFAGTEPPR
mmetsp:Transcript_114435/g.363714  ORF Transcript_114435/g.363714 Transcript_114435/m.363714 type:complete len:266 (-) Transcript_114435:575-1372(-)